MEKMDNSVLHAAKAKNEKKRSNVSRFLWCCIFSLPLYAVIVIVARSPIGDYLAITMMSSTTHQQTEIAANGSKQNGQVKRSKKMVPFYLYDFKDFPSFWGEDSKCNHGRVYTPKHDHAQFVWHYATRHPWRTANPLTAQLAVLPLSIDLHARQGCPDLSWSQVVNETKRVLQRSPIFPHVRHLIIANDWKSQRLAKEIMQILSPAGIQANMEGRGDCYTSLGYTSRYATSMSLRSPNYKELLPNPQRTGTERIYSVNMVGQVDERSAYQDRLSLFQSKGFIPSPYIVSSKVDTNKVHAQLRHCNGTDDFDRCITPPGHPTYSETQHSQELSNYTLCLRGDTLGSDRWINGMVAGTALIQVADDEDSALGWLPFPEAVPWKDIVITIPRDSYRRDPAAAIRRVLDETSEQKLLELQQLSLQYAADVDWTAHNSRALENLLIEAVSVPCAKFDNNTHELLQNRSKLDI
jgi:hypothetical protein